MILKLLIHRIMNKLWVYLVTFCKVNLQIVLKLYKLSGENCTKWGDLRSASFCAAHAQFCHWPCVSATSYTH